MCGKDKLFPVGFNRFGEIYQWQSGEELEAVMYLLGLRRGYIRSVFSNDDIESIDIAWGDERGGFCHIIQKHLIEGTDFESVQQIVNTIKETLSKGLKTEQGSNISYDYQNWRVSLAQSAEGTWVLTAFDKSRTRKEKIRVNPNTTN